MFDPIQNLEEHLQKRTTFLITELTPELKLFYEQLADYAARIITKALAQNQYERALIVYCGSGKVVRNLAETGKIVVGVETHPDFLTEAKERHLIKGCTGFSLEQEGSRLELHQFRPEVTISPFSIHRMRDPETTLKQIVSATEKTVYLIDFVRDIAPEDLLYLTFLEDLKGESTERLPDQTPISEALQRNLNYPFITTQGYLSSALQSALTLEELDILLKTLNRDYKTEIRDVKGPCKTTLPYAITTITQK